MANIAEILKNAPKGLKLYSPMVGECELEKIDQNGLIDIKYINNGIDGFVTLTSSGEFANKGECVLFPNKDYCCWDTWQYQIFENNKGVVVVDKVTGYRYIVANKEGYKCAFFDIFGNISNTINVNNLVFADADTEFQYLSQLKENGYYYNDGNIFYDGENEQKNVKQPSRNDYKKIIEHYGVRNQLKKLSEEIYELQEALIEYGLMPCEENKGNVVEEMADVMVLLKEFADWFEIKPENIAEIMLNKVDRTLERIKKEE